MDVKFHASSYKVMKAIFTAKKIIEHKIVKAGKDKEIEMHREISECFEKGRDHEDVKNLVEEIDEYNKALKSIGVQDWEVS
jgi:hypothetical protein